MLEVETTPRVRRRPRDRKPRTRLWVVAVSIVVAALGVVAVPLLGRHWVAGTALVDAPRALEQIERLRTDDGIVAAPPVLGAGTLDGTGWSALLNDVVGAGTVRPDRVQLEEMTREEAQSAPIWSAFYYATATRQAGRPIDPDLVTPIMTRLTELPAAPGADVPSVALELWAGVNTLSLANQPVDDVSGISTWARGVLSSCDVNGFVAAHLAEIVERIDGLPTSEGGRLLAACPAYAAVPDDIAEPTNEAELLELVGAAVVLDRLPGTVEESELRQDLRAALEPAGHMAYDPWWTYYAAKGYVAAGGSPSSYADVAEAIVSHADEHGLIPSPTMPAADLQTTYLAVRVVEALGQDPGRLVTDAALLNFDKRPEATAWTDANRSMWAALLFMAGVQLDPQRQQELTVSAQRCADVLPDPATARAVGLCRSVVDHLGGRATSEIDWNLWKDAGSAAVVDATVALQAAPPKELAAAAILDVREDLTDASTTILARLPIAAKISGTPLDEKTLDEISSEIDARRADAPFDGLFREFRDDANPSYYSTLAVATLDTWRNGASA